MASSYQSQQENRHVDAYLQYLVDGTLPVSSNHERQIEQLDVRIANEDRMFVKVQLVQQRQDLIAPEISPADLIAAFVQAVPGFSERNGITYATWRSMGVPAKVLGEAGFKLPSGGGAKMAPDDPRRQRDYVPRRVWTADEKVAYMAFYEEHGPEATAEHYGGKLSGTKQRYYGFKSEARAAAGLPPRSRAGRPRKDVSQAS